MSKLPLKKKKKKKHTNKQCVNWTLHKATCQLEL